MTKLGDCLNKKILLVDDSASIRELARSILISDGFEHVDEAANGVQALKLIKVNGYDVVISDWNMPEMDGIELYESIQADPALNIKDFILLTSVAEKEKVMLAIGAGIKHYIVKPFNANTLFKEVLQCLVDK